MPEPDDPLRVLEARALTLLARREHTRAELARKLARAPDKRTLGLTPEDEFAPPLQAEFAESAAALGAAIETVLGRLTAQGLLSDRRAAEAIVQARRSQRGLVRIVHELEQKGVPAEVAAGALAGLREDQTAAARAVWRKRFGSLPVDAADRARQTRFLASRGFAFEVIRTVLGGVADECE
jgi:regulatory protein